jgi:3-oxoadipate enol-lactonase
MTQHIVASDECRIAYRLDGPPDAPVLVLSNSLGATMEMWDPQIPAFSKYFRVLRYDSRGHGDSDAPPGGYAIDRLGQDVLDLADALGVDAFAFCGLSMGGLVGQWLALEHGERLRGLVLANTAARVGTPEAWSDRIGQVSSLGLAGMADVLIGRFFSPEFINNNHSIIGNIREMILKNSPHGYTSCCESIRDIDNRYFLDKISVRTLIVCGNSDLSTPPSDGDFLYRNISNSSIMNLDAAHLSNIESSDDFNRCVVDFLNDQLK